MPRVIANPGKCAACRICQLACSMSHEGVFSPALARVHVARNNRTGEIRLSISETCDGCPGEKEPGCVRSCFFGALTEVL